MVTVCCLQEVLLQLRWEELEEAGEGKEGIARIDGLGHPPPFPYRGAVAAEGGDILNIIMDEGEIVDKLDAGGSRQGLIWVPPNPPAGQKAEGRPEPLPPLQRVTEHPAEGQGGEKGIYLFFQGLEESFLQRERTCHSYAMLSAPS